MLFRWREVCESLLKGALDDCWTIPKRSMTQVRRHSVAYSRLYRRNTASVASEYVSFGITLAPPAIVGWGLEQVCAARVGLPLLKGITSLQQIDRRMR